MGLLIKLKNEDTSLKSLKFGQDRPGGGDSGQPYIQSPIEGQAENTAIDGDGIIRGGLTAPSRAFEDATRLSKYFFDFKNPNGLLFTAKQNLLSRIATKAETASGPAYGGFSKSITILGQGKTALESKGSTEGNGAINEGIYTPLSTLLQSQVGYLGQHVNKMGLDPTGNFPNAAIKKYGDVVFEKNKANRNGEGPIRNIVPLKVIRKEQRANTKLERAKSQQERAKTESTEEKVIKPLIKGNLEKWEAYRDKQTQDRLENKNAKVENAQSNLQSIENTKSSTTQEVYYDNRLLNLWNSKGLNLSKPLGTLDSILYSYGGGPNSALGIGQTNIKFATLNDGITPARTGYSGLDPYFGDYNYSTNNPITYSTINIFGDSTNSNSVSLRYLNNNPQVTKTQVFGSENYLIDKDNSESIQPWLNGNYVRSLTGTVLDTDNDNTIASTWRGTDFTSQELNKTGKLKQDFRKKLVSDQTKTFISKSPDYLKENQERRVNMGQYNDPGQKGDVSNYTLGKRNPQGKILGPVDTINALPVYKSTDNSPLYKDGKDSLVNDFCKFRFAILDNDTTAKFFLHFRAYLDGFKDGYKAKYKSLNYVGRGEEFHKYGGFSRDISFSFKVVAMSKQELLPMYRKLNFLASSLAPSYTNAGYMGGTMTEITIGSYLYNQPGIITSINLTAPKETTWEIQVPLDASTEDGTGKASDFTDKSVQELPHMIEVDVSFTPIHNFRVQRQRNAFMTKDEFSLGSINGIEDKNAYGSERYINLKEGGSDGYINYEPDEDVEIVSRTQGDQNQILDPETAADNAEKALLQEQQSQEALNLLSDAGAFGFNTLL
tara:strand:+ start:439 stop:2934 length:2496 start_codon:yes stop_codon:yes gene_type:complete